MRLSRLGVACAFMITLAPFGTRALAADAPPSSDDVLKKLHHSNQHEIQMGKLAEKRGHGKDVKVFGKMLVKDHGSADKKVTALAKQEKVDLPEGPAMGDDIPAGPDFDAAFARSMLEDHKKDVAEATAARDATQDPKLKKLLTEMVPTLQKHLDTAQKIVDGAGAK